MNSSQQQMGQKEHVMCLQRFVKSNGSKSFLCRTVYSQTHSSECYLITNTRNFLTKISPRIRSLLSSLETKVRLLNQNKVKIWSKLVNI